MSTTTEQSTEQTEQAATEPSTTATTEQTEPTTEQTTPQADPEPADKAGKEAAKYRRQLRETENALQGAQDATQAAQRTLVEHLAQSAGVKPAALWASGAELAGLLDESGNVDPGKVTEAAESAMSTLGLSRTPRPDRTQGGMGTAVPSAPEFRDAFTPQG